MQGLEQLPLFSLIHKGNFTTFRTEKQEVTKNYQFSDQLIKKIQEGSRKQKVRRNLEAIKILKNLEETEGTLNNAEKEALAQYLGFGLAPELFMESAPSDWKELSQELSGLVKAETWYQLRRNVSNAYYTDPTVIKAVWKGIKKMGFKGGKILEPGAGTGLWIGLTPKELQKDCQWTGVEIDPTAGQIAKILYPEAEMHLRGFEDILLPENFFDLAIGNVPFGATAPNDGTLPKVASTLHDYFIIKALELIRPGGLLAVLTSVGTLQSKRGKETRKWIAQKGELVGAMRLPCTTFQKFTGTSVTTDLIILRKREEPLYREKISSEERYEWTEVSTSNITGEDGKPLAIPGYYERHPDMMLGRPTIDKLYGGKNRLGLEPDGRDLESAIEEAFEKLPKIYQRSTEKSQRSSDRLSAKSKASRTRSIPAELQDKVKPYSYVWVENKAWQVRQGKLHRCSAEGTTETRLYWLIQLKDTVKEVFEIQIKGGSNSELSEAQEKLQTKYERFVKRYSWIHDIANKRTFSEDPEYPILLALENYNPEKPEKTEKTEIFTKRTITEHKPKTSAASATEALIYSLSEKGNVDPEYMSWLTKKTKEQVVAELSSKGIIYYDPATNKWTTADEYLSGNVRLKLEQATAAEAINPTYKANVEALKEVQPKDLSAGEIYARLGTSWIPTDDIEKFIAETLNVEPKEIKVRYLKSISSWSVDISSKAERSQTNWTLLGTSRVPAHRLIEMALNLSSPVVKDKVSENEYVINKKETRLARSKQEALKEKFKRWVWSDLERAERLAKIYNLKHNCFALRKFNGSHLELPGMNPSWKAKLRPHQLNAIWRIISAGNTLISHPVGAGKTIVMIAAAMELKRLRICSKPCLVIKDHMVEQVAAEAIQLYPKARILIAGSAEMSKTKRQEMTARIAAGDWDIILTSHTGLSKLKLSPEKIEEILKEEVSLVEEEYQKRSLEKGEDSKRAVKILERKLDSLKKRILETANNETKDQTLWFDQTGIDHLFYDESQDVKRKELNSKMDRVLGVPQGHSYRAEDFYQKTRYISSVMGEGRGINLLTATPISNTMAEAWVNQIYLQYHTLQNLGLVRFDDWVSNYAEIKTAAEVTAQLTIEIKSRLALFNNLPEWRTLFWQVADVVTEEELKIPRPSYSYETIEVPASPEQLKFFESIAQRAEAIQEGKVEPEEDNMPLIVTNIRQGVIDLRLLPKSVLSKFLSQKEIDALEKCHTKVDACIENVHKIWKETRHSSTTQLIFCDLGTPKKNSTQFSVYDKLKSGLIEKGIPKEDIAFIHDAKSNEEKAVLFRKVRHGKIGVFILSTEKGGVGTNCQDHVVAQHDLDCPLRPTDHTQRRGRSARQGNRHKHVPIYRYVTSGKPYNEKGQTVTGLSPDSYLYQMSLTKGAFIEQGLSGQNKNRSIEDCSEMLLSLAETMACATGDPRLVRKVELDNTINRLLIEEQDFINQQLSVRRELKRIAGAIEALEAKRDHIREDAKKIEDRSGKKFQILLKKGKSETRVTQRTKAGQIINQLAMELEVRSQTGAFKIGEFSNFEVVIERPELQIKANKKDSQRWLLKLIGKEVYGTTIGETSAETCYSLEYLLSNRIVEAEREASESIRIHQKDHNDLEAQKEKPFPLKKELNEAIAEREQLEQELGLSTDKAIEVIAS
jgi:N12 class adenine-specific DNA methylase